MIQREIAVTDVTKVRILKANDAGEMLADAVRGPRFGSAVVTTLTVVALGLAVFGLYGFARFHVRTGK